MKTLFIDTHLNDIRIYLFENNIIIKKAEVIGERQNSIFLMPSIKTVCDDEVLDEIAVVIGPGSFTGVRLGVTVAKTLAYTKNIPIKVISYFEMMKESIDEKTTIMAVSDGNGYFIAEYENDLLIKDYYYVSNQDFKNLSVNKKIITDVTIDYDKVIKYLNNLSVVPVHGVKPLYIKLIGALNATQS